MYSKQIGIALDLLKKGEIVVFPTDTLYALGADPNNDKAITEIFKLKGRSFQQPLPILLPSINNLSNWVDPDILSNDKLRKKIFAIAEDFWPGPLTIVVKKSKQVSNLLTANQDTIALRIPNHPLALELLTEFNSGIIGTSANKSGEANLITAQQAIDTFNNKVFVIDGGKCRIGIGSTIISIIDGIKILRAGAISLEQLSSYL